MLYHISIFAHVLNLAHLHMIWILTYPQTYFYMLEDCNMIESLRSRFALFCQFSYSSDNDHSLSHILHLLLNHIGGPDSSKEDIIFESFWLFSSLVKRNWDSGSKGMNPSLSLDPHYKVLIPEPSLQNITSLLIAWYVWLQNNIIKVFSKYSKVWIMKIIIKKKIIKANTDQTANIEFYYTVIYNFYILD